MGAAGSKSARPAAAVARRAAAEPPVVRTNLTLEDLAALSRRSGAPTSRTAGASGVQVSDRAAELVEMDAELLRQAERFEDFGRVEYLEEMTKEFERTASSHRPRSNTPVAMPKDRTAAVSTGGVVVEEHMPGRLTNAQLRTLLRLHYEEPSEWTPAVLARKYALEERVVVNVLRSVGPPNVLPPAGPSEHPLGVWYAPTPAQLEAP